MSVLGNASVSGDASSLSLCELNTTDYKAGGRDQVRMAGKYEHPKSQMNIQFTSVNQ